MTNKAHNKETARPSLLILGDLELEPAHRERLQSLVSRVDCHGHPDPQTIEALLPRYNSLFACNVMLTPYISKLAAMDLVVLAESGIVHLDAAQARQAGVNFTNIPGYSTEAVVQYILRCVLESLRPWHKIFSPDIFPVKAEKIGHGLENVPVGIVGYGLIGKRLTDLLSALGCRILLNTRHPFTCLNATWLPLDQLFSRSRIVIICCTSNDESRDLFDGDLLSRLPQHSVLVSVSNRDVFAPPALQQTLQNRPDITAWLDIDWQPSDTQLLALPNVNISPHLAFYTQQTLTNRVDSCIDQLATFYR
ncbi:MAG: NAD(P)-dependent oxidoreductase [Thermodesulfobacteriota bacterium]|nr:NAD(P)-dependent oxidoreductase [Thermodesulfobacteriota bacterium]